MMSVEKILRNIVQKSLFSEETMEKLDVVIKKHLQSIKFTVPV